MATHSRGGVTVPLLPQHLRRTLSALAVALVAVSLAVAVALGVPKNASGQGAGLEITSVTATCSPTGIHGSVWIANTSSASLTGRVRLFLAARDGASGAWARYGSELFADRFDTGGGTTAEVAFGPLDAGSAPAGSSQVRVEAVLDAVTVDPAGSTIVIWDVDTAASTTECASAAPSPANGQALYASGFDATCGPTSFNGGITLANNGAYPQDVKADIRLARLAGGTWTPVPGATQVYSTTIAPSGGVTVPVSFTLNGMAADTSAVRVEMALTGIDFVAGQARRNTTNVEGPAVHCTAVTGVANKDKYTVVLGDTLSGIAALNKVAVADLAEANGLDTDASVAIGQVLTVPKSAVQPVTTKPSGAAGRGTVVPGEPVVRSTRAPSPTPEPEETGTPVPEASKTAVPGAGATNVADPSATSGPGGGATTETGEAPGGYTALLMPIGIGLVAIFVIGGSALAGVMLIRRVRSGGGGGTQAAVNAMALPAQAALPPQTSAPLPTPQPKKSGTKEDPAAIPLSGDMRDLLGIERNRSAIAREFAPDPDAVVAASSILAEARDLMRRLDHVA